MIGQNQETFSVSNEEGKRVFDLLSEMGLKYPAFTVFIEGNIDSIFMRTPVFDICGEREGNIYISNMYTKMDEKTGLVPKSLFDVITEAKNFQDIKSKEVVLEIYLKLPEIKNQIVSEDVRSIRLDLIEHTVTLSF
jgi:hypothetical protein